METVCNALNQILMQILGFHLIVQLLLHCCEWTIDYETVTVTLRNIYKYAKMVPITSCWTDTLTIVWSHCIQDTSLARIYSFNDLYYILWSILFSPTTFWHQSAPEYFQCQMSEMLKDKLGVVCLMDDILVYGAAQQEHDVCLEAVLQTMLAMAWPE